MYAAPPITTVVRITHLAYIWDMLGSSLIPITFLQLFYVSFLLLLWMCHDSGGYWLACHLVWSHARFMVNKGALGEIFSQVAQFSPASVILILFVHEPCCIISGMTALLNTVLLCVSIIPQGKCKLATATCLPFPVYYLYHTVW